MHHMLLLLQVATSLLPTWQLVLLRQGKWPPLKETGVVSLQSYRTAAQIPFPGCLFPLSESEVSASPPFHCERLGHGH